MEKLGKFVRSILSHKEAPKGLVVIIIIVVIVIYTLANPGFGGIVGKPSSNPTLVSDSGSTSSSSSSVTLRHNTGNEVQMFKGDRDTIYDETLAMFPNGTDCTELDTGYFDIGLDDLVKYHYLRCEGKKGWVNSKYVK